MRYTVQYRGYPRPDGLIKIRTWSVRAQTKTDAQDAARATLRGPVRGTWVVDLDPEGDGPDRQAITRRPDQFTAE